MNLLQRDMERSKRRLNEFCASMLQDADTKIAGHNNFMQKAGHKKNALRNEIDAYRTEATKMKGDLVKENIELKTILSGLLSNSDISFNPHISCLN